MTDSQARKWVAGFAGIILALSLAYSNHFHNSFHFDDAHTIENNAAIRELGNIPRFFTDASTFSALPSNQSYRPLDSTLFAIDYALGGGLRPFWFHLSIFPLFAALVLLAGVLVFRTLHPLEMKEVDLWIALAAAAWYGLHPANADTVNYIIASAEIISTLGVVGSFVIYLEFPKLRRTYLFILPAAIAVLAKPPAAVFAVLFALYRCMFPTKADAAQTPGGRVLAYLGEVIPAFMLCGAALWLVQKMTPHTWVAGAASAHDYLITQPYVALQYLKEFFWPSNLSADYDLTPFATTDDPRFWIGFAFAISFAILAVFCSAIRKTRVVGFGLLWFLVSLLPTSLLPLAEVMNDHRTFFPYIGLVIAAAGAASLVAEWSGNAGKGIKAVAGFLVCLFLCGNGCATFQRNKAWLTEESLWHDVTIKSPGNGRGLMNYGNTLMERGDFAGALDYFHRALALTPRYSVLLINLGVAEAATGDISTAEQHFRQAMQLDPSNPVCYTYYARFLISEGRRAEAGGLVRHALTLSPGDAMANELLAQTQPAGATAGFRVRMAPEALLDLSLQLYQAGRYADSINACREALAIRPNYSEAWNNIGAAFNKLGRYDEAASACMQALRLNPNFELARNNLKYALSMARAGATPEAGK